MEKITRNRALFTSAFVATLVAPFAIKVALTGRVGWNYEFYVLAAWAPATSLAFGSMRGRLVFFSTLALYAAAFATIWLKYPADPLMDFERQFLYEAQVPLAIAIAGSVVISALRRRSGSRRSRRHEPSPGNPGATEA